MSKRKKHIKNSGIEREGKEMLKMKESIEEAKNLQEVLNSCVFRCSDIFPLLIYISTKQENKKSSKQCHISRYTKRHVNASDTI